MKLKFKLLALILILSILISLSFVLASDNGIEGNDNSFKNLRHDIKNSNTTFNMQKNYKCNSNDSTLTFTGKNLTINGNGHKIDGSDMLSGLDFKTNDEECKIIINNVTLSNFKGPAISIHSLDFEFNNVTFTDNTGNGEGIIIIEDSNNFTFNNCTFKSNSNASSIHAMTSNLTVKNSIFSGNNEGFSAIDNNRGSLIIDNSDFKNYNAHYGAILNYKGDYFSIKNSNFSNSHAMRTGGAILGKFFPNDDLTTSGDMIIENCSFTNLSSQSNGGIIYMDLDSGSAGIPKTLNITDSNFINSSSKFGGAIVNLGGNVNVKNSKFINNAAKSTGGAIYTSWTNLTIDNSSISQNIAKSNASAIYFDKGIFTINDSNITDNHAPESGNVIYVNDASNHFTNSIFDNNGVIYGNFNVNSEIKNLTSKDQLSLNNTDYIFYVENKGIKLNLKNNTGNNDKLPVKYDGRDYGLVTPIKVQGDNFACWAFATAGAIESSLLKSTGKA